MLRAAIRHSRGDTTGSARVTNCDDQRGVAHHASEQLRRAGNQRARPDYRQRAIRSRLRACRRERTRSRLRLAARDGGDDNDTAAISARASDGFATLDDLVQRIAADGHGVVMTMEKNGDGKTTRAARLAVTLARAGNRVHLLTTDPAADVQAAVSDARGNATGINAQCSVWLQWYTVEWAHHARHYGVMRTHAAMTRRTAVRTLARMPVRCARYVHAMTPTLTTASRNAAEARLSGHLAMATV